MASRTSTDPLEILLEMGVDLDNLSEEEDYLSALIEATNILTIKSASDPRIRILQQEIRKVRQKRKAADTKFKARKTTVSASKLTNRSSAPTQRKQMSGATFFALPPATDQKKEEKKKGSPNNLLKEISETVTRIADILKDQYDLKKDTATFDRKKAERERRDLQKKNLAKRFEGLKRVAEKLIAPVKGIFDRIMGFLFNIILGKFLIKLVEWFSNPDNQSKVKSIIRFLTDNWPKLLSAYIIFGTGLGKFSRFLVKILARGAVRLAAATTGLLARLFGARALGKFSRFFGRRGKVIAGGIEAVTTIIAFKALENAFTKGIAPEESASIDNDIPVSGYQGGGLVQPILKFQGGGPVKFNLLDPRTWFSGKAQQTIGDKTGRYSDDTLSGRLLNRRNATNEAIMKMRGYEEGGEVDGPGGIDKVPAMLTDGEFVMSRGAVQKYGLAQLEAMNAAGGGTNQPKIMNGTVFAFGGGSFGGGPMFPENPGDLIPNLGIRDAIEQLMRERDKVVEKLIKAGYLSKEGRFEGAAKMQALNFISDLTPEKGFASTMNKTNNERILNQFGISRDTKGYRPDGKTSLKDVFYSGQGGLDRSYQYGMPQVNMMSDETKALYLKMIRRHIAAGTLRDGMTLNPYGLVSKNDPRYREQGTVTLKIHPETGKASLIDLYKFDVGEVNLGQGTAQQAQYEEQVKAFQDPNRKMFGLPVGKLIKFLNLKPTKDATEGGMASQLLIALANRLVNFDPQKERERDLRERELAIKEGRAPRVEELSKVRKTFVQADELNSLGDLSYVLKSGLTPQQRKAMEKEEEARALAEKKRKNEEALIAKRPWYDKLGLFGGASAVMQAEQKKERDDLLKGMSETQKRLFRGGGGFAALEDGKTLEQIISGGKLALKPQLEKENQSMMNMMMGGKDAYYSSTTGMYYKNYAEALKDPKVAAAAQVEKFKKQYSFTPSTNQQPNLTIPGMPTNASGSNITVIKAPSQSTGPNLGGGGSEVPSRPPGSGDPAKFRILGLAGLAAG